MSPRNIGGVLGFAATALALSAPARAQLVSRPATILIESPVFDVRSATVLMETWPVALRIPTVFRPCAADWNGDRVSNSADFFDFLTCFFLEDADYNADGMTNTQDFFDFLAAFFAGAC